MFDRSEFSKRLQKLIDLNKNSKEKICDELGISEQSLYNYLNGKRMPHIDVIIDMAEYFHTTTDYLLIGIESRNIFDSTGLLPDQISMIYDLIKNFKRINSYLGQGKK